VIRHGNKKASSSSPAYILYPWIPSCGTISITQVAVRITVFGPVYATPPVLQRGYGIGSILSGLWRVFRPILWSGIKALGRETLRKGGDILTDIARSPTDQNHKDIVSKHVTESTQNIIAKLMGRGRKLKRNGKTVKPRASKKPRLTKRNIFA